MENGSWNVRKHHLYGSVYAMLTIVILLPEQDDETLDNFYTSW